MPGYAIYPEAPMGVITAQVGIEHNGFCGDETAKPRVLIKAKRARSFGFRKRTGCSRCQQCFSGERDYFWFELTGLR
jgi:hypothetical protein